MLTPTSVRLSRLGRGKSGVRLVYQTSWNGSAVQAIVEGETVAEALSKAEKETERKKESIRSKMTPDAVDDDSVPF